MLHSLQYLIEVLIDYKAMRGIVKKITLNTTLTDQSNQWLVNASIYLSKYRLKVYYLVGWLNLVPNALLHLAALGDNKAKERPEEAVLNSIWTNHYNHILFIVEAQIDDELQL